MRPARCAVRPPLRGWLPGRRGAVTRLRLGSTSRCDWRSSSAVSRMGTASSLRSYSSAPSFVWKRVCYRQRRLSGAFDDFCRRTFSRQSRLSPVWSELLLDKMLSGRTSAGGVKAALPQGLATRRRSSAGSASAAPLAKSASVSASSFSSRGSRSVVRANSSAARRASASSATKRARRETSAKVVSR